MSRTMDVIPDTLPCESCLEVLPASKFRRDRTSARRVITTGAGQWVVWDVCVLCQNRRARGVMSDEMRARYDEVSKRNKAVARARQVEARRDRRERERHDLARLDEERAQKRNEKAGKLAPYDQAVAELSAQWGIPVTEWKIKHDRECTLRMYDILGWQRDTFFHRTTPHSTTTRHA